MSYIDHFTEFLFDEKRRLSSKAAVVLFIVLAICFVDNMLGFSHSFNIDKKIGQVQKLNAILKDTTIDSTTKAFALSLRSEIIERQNIAIQTLSLFRGKSNNSIKYQPNNSRANAKPINETIKSNFWFNVTASGIYFLFAVLMIPLMLVADKTTSLAQRLATGVVTTISFVLFGLFFIWVLSVIPRISSSTWLWNYILNFMIQAGMIGLLVHISKMKK
jgi:hypothetical protein